MDLQPIPVGLVVKHGSHKSLEAGACLLEVVSYVAGEAWSDHPACACPVIAAFGRALNDRMPSDEMRTELLLPLVPLIAGSKSTPEVESRRRWMAADFAVREMLPQAAAAAYAAAAAAAYAAAYAYAYADAAYADAARHVVFTQAAGLLKRMCEVTE